MHREEPDEYYEESYETPDEELSENRYWDCYGEIPEESAEESAEEPSEEPEKPREEIYALLDACAIECFGEAPSTSQYAYWIDVWGFRPEHIVEALRRPKKRPSDTGVFYLKIQVDTILFCEMLSQRRK